MRVQSNRQTSLVLVAVCIATGCAASFKPSTQSGVASPTLTPERARAALLEMMRSPQGKALGWFDGDVPDKMATMPIVVEEEGWYRWTGGFVFHPARGIYVLTVRPRPGAQACVFEYKGTYVTKGRRWSATPPEMVSTTMQLGE